MNEDISSVSPTLGFIIKTIDYDGYALFPQPMGFDFSHTQDTNLTSVLDSSPYPFQAPTDSTFPLGDVGGQKTLRTYWKNYFEKTDTLIWVVDATDRERIDDCRRELEALLLEEVRVSLHP